jgi:hypothetical protein
VDTLLVLRVFGGVNVKPLLDVNDTRAVVDLVGDVCGLVGYGADLADEGYLGDFVAVELEFGVRVGRELGVYYLFDCYRAEAVFPMCLDLVNVSLYQGEASLSPCLLMGCLDFLLVSHRQNRLRLLRLVHHMKWLSSPRHSRHSLMLTTS